MQYVDSSALVKLYVRETDSATAERLLSADPLWVTAAHTQVEVRRTLALRAPPGKLTQLKSDFARDWDRLAVVALDAATCRLAADLAEGTRVRSLDALHLAAAQRVGAPVVRLVTFDLRLGQAARSLGWSVVGA